MEVGGPLRLPSPEVQGGLAPALPASLSAREQARKLHAGGEAGCGLYINGNKQQATNQTHGEARATQETGQQPALPPCLCLRSSFLYLMAREASPAEFSYDRGC